MEDSSIDHNIIHKGTSGSFTNTFSNLTGLAMLLGLIYVLFSNGNIFVWILIGLIAGFLILMNYHTHKFIFYYSHIDIIYPFRRTRRKIRIDKEDILRVEIKDAYKSMNKIIVFHTKNKKYSYFDVNPQLLDHLYKTYNPSA